MLPLKLMIFFKSVYFRVYPWLNSLPQKYKESHRNYYEKLSKEEETHLCKN